MRFAPRRRERIIGSAWRALEQTKPRRSFNAISYPDKPGLREPDSLHFFRIFKEQPKSSLLLSARGALGAKFGRGNLGHFSRKEVIQPHLPIRLPCYDFTPVMKLTVVGALLAVRQPASGEPHSHGVTGGVYKARERIHRSMLICDY